VTAAASSPHTNQRRIAGKVVLSLADSKLQGEKVIWLSHRFLCQTSVMLSKLRVPFQLRIETASCHTHDIVRIEKAPRSNTSLAAGREHNKDLSELLDGFTRRQSFSEDFGWSHPRSVAS